MYRQGLILVVTGDGKGKTTSAMGMAVRAMGHGMRVAIIQFMKGSSNYGEYQFFRQFDESKIIFKQAGRPEFVNRDNPAEIDRTMASRGWELARKYLQGQCDLLILDEINVAMNYGLIEVEPVAEALRAKNPNTAVILTGRGAPRIIRELADTVSVVGEEKHHYAAGIQAQAGMEF